MDVYRCNETGEALKQDGSMLVVQLHIDDAAAILDGKESVCTYEAMKRSLDGFQPHNKFSITKLDPRSLHNGQLPLRLTTENEGDITLRIAPNVNVRSFEPVDFEIDQVSDNPAEFKAKGVLKLRLLGLLGIGAVRREREWISRGGSNPFSGSL